MVVSRKYLALARAESHVRLTSTLLVPNEPKAMTRSEFRSSVYSTTVPKYWNYLIIMCCSTWFCVRTILEIAKLIPRRFQIRNENAVRTSWRERYVLNGVSCKGNVIYPYAIRKWRLYKKYPYSTRKLYAIVNVYKYVECGMIWRECLIERYGSGGNDLDRRMTPNFHTRDMFISSLPLCNPV